MRKVVLYQLLSLDGVAEEPGDWVFDDGPELFANLAGIIERQDAVLLGRGTYDYWVDFWPTADVEPFASFVNGTTKHVFTSTAPTAPWANSVVVTDPAPAYVAELKRRTGGDIGVHGSIRLAQSLLAANLIDEIRLEVSPSFGFPGRRLFTEADGPRRLELIHDERSPTGTMLLGYRVLGADGG